MKDMVGDLRSATVSPKHWPTVHIYWSLLQSNELIKDLPIVENMDCENYSLRCRQEIADMSLFNLFTKTWRELQEVLQMFQVAIKNRL